MKNALRSIIIILLLILFSVSFGVCSYAQEAAETSGLKVDQESLYGTWTEEYYKRPQMQIYPGSYNANDTEEHDLYIVVYWANTSMDGMEYVFFADQTEDENVYRYENGVINGCIYDSGEGVVRRNYTEDSKGTISVFQTENGEMEINWIDSFDESCEKLHLIQIEKGIPGSDAGAEDSGDEPAPYLRAFPMTKQAE